MLKTFLLLALSVTIALSQNVTDEPFEPKEGMTYLLQKDYIYNKPTTLLDYLFLTAISFYRNSISEKSISRCPFEISCSRFAEIAIKKYGLLGYAIFIDRFFYRENISAFSLYTKKQLPNGLIKLDDKIFLEIFH